MKSFNLKGIRTANCVKYDDGLSFTVMTELNAYKAAHMYQGPNIHHTTVRYSPAVGQWLVQIFNTEYEGR